MTTYSEDRWIITLPKGDKRMANYSSWPTRKEGIAFSEATTLLTWQQLRRAGYRAVKAKIVWEEEP